MADFRVAGSLFVDMKYIFLYHKLGFRETDRPNQYIKHYRDSAIIIESDEQCYLFHDQRFNLTHHRDFVILELVDRISESVGSTAGILIEENGLSYQYKGDRLKILCEAWGNDFKLKCDDTTFDADIIYTSRLNGGLIEYMIDNCNHSFDYGSIGVNDSNRHSPHRDCNLPDKNGFIISGNKLLGYLGNDSSVVVPEGVTYVDAGVFWDKQFIKEIVLPKTLSTIGGDAFAYCESLLKLEIPQNVVEIGDDPFAGCVKLHLTNKSVEFVLKDNVLFTRDGTRLIHYSAWKSDEIYNIDDSVEWIGKHSFYKCINLKKVIIGRGVDYMGNNPFSDCFNITLENRSPHYQYTDGALMDKRGTTIIHYSLGMDRDEYSIPESVTTIGRNAFWNCKRLKVLRIGKNVRQIGYNPFANCTNLQIESDSEFYSARDGILYDSSFRELIFCSNESAKKGVIIPESVENIGRNAFSGCESLKRITIPASVKTISRGAFTNCVNLSDVTLFGKVETVDKWAFAYCSSLKNIRINSDANIHADAFLGSKTEVILC